MLLCPVANAMVGRREVTVTERVAQADSHGSKSGAHEEKDIVSGREKHVKKMEKD